MNIRDYPTLHLDTMQSKGPAFLLLLYIFAITEGYSIMCTIQTLAYSCSAILFANKQTQLDVTHMSLQGKHILLLIVKSGKNLLGDNILNFVFPFITNTEVKCTVQNIYLIRLML